jgi:hypothetical protein
LKSELKDVYNIVGEEIGSVDNTNTPQEGNVEATQNESSEKSDNENEPKVTTSGQ